MIYCILGTDTSTIVIDNGRQIICLDCGIRIDTGEDYNYVKAIEGTTNLKVVKFKVEASHDIYISLTGLDGPFTEVRYEIMFGGLGGTRSEIRRMFQDQPTYTLVTVSHTVEQFNQVYTTKPLRTLIK